MCPHGTQGTFVFSSCCARRLLTPPSPNPSYRFSAPATLCGRVFPSMGFIILEIFNFPDGWFMLHCVTKYVIQHFLCLWHIGTQWFQRCLYYEASNRAENVLPSQEQKQSSVLSLMGVGSGMCSLPALFDSYFSSFMSLAALNTSLLCWRLGSLSALAFVLRGLGVGLLSLKGQSRSPCEDVLWESLMWGMSDTSPFNFWW